MKYLIISLLLIFLLKTSCFSQERVNFKLEGSKIDGVTFARDYVLKFRLKNVSERFTPTLENIKTGEDYLLSNNKSVKYSGLSGIFTPDRLQEKMKTYKRQYIGFLNTEKDSIIFIQLLDFKHKKQAKREFEGWEQEFLVAVGGFYEDNIVRFLVNISKKTVSIY